MLLSKRLRMLRAYHNFTQQQMANLLGLTLNAYQKYELAENKPPLETLVKIADIFNVPTDFLLGRDEYLQSIGIKIDLGDLENEKPE